MKNQNLSVPLAFVIVLFIWSTTPLAIKWSAADTPMFSVLIRMIIGALFSLVVLGLTTTTLPLKGKAIQLYVFNGLSIFFGMSLFYLAAQHIPSGWIAVIFGLSPLLTGIVSAFVEPETKLTRLRVTGILLGLSGLFLVFYTGLNVNEASLIGVVLSVIGTFSSSITSVITRQLVKPLKLSGMQITTGSLIVALPFFLLAAWLSPSSFDTQLSTQALWSTIYLGLIGTGVGFSLYYFLLKHTSAAHVSLIALVTPITALMLGSWLNAEPLIANVWIGAGLVSLGLILYQFKPRLGLRKL